MSYSRLTVKDRIRISRYRKQGKSRSEIARLLGFHRSTICREVKRNKHGRKYDFWRAHKYARNRQKVRRYPYKLTPEIWSLIEERLWQRWSPEQIYYRLQLEGFQIVSIETIYRYIYLEKQLGGRTWSYLRRSHRRRRRRLFSRDHGKIKDTRPIAQRPQSVRNRKEVGHWERDTMSAGKSKMDVLILNERATRFNRFVKITGKKSIEVTSKTIEYLKDLPCKTITNDRGREFSDHLNCENKMAIKVFFCDPYSPHQRGTNENRIGILRQYLPKQYNHNKVSQLDLNRIEIEINNRPMKCLDWRTPHEAMMEKLLR